MEIQSPLERAIAHVEREHRVMSPGPARDAVERTLAIVKSYQVHEPMWEHQVYSQGFKDAVKIKKNEQASH